MNQAVTVIVISQVRDVVAVRRRTRQIAELLNLTQQDATRITTAVSEIARNAYEYAGGGKVELVIEGAAGAAQTLLVRISDKGRGIENLPEILGGKYRSSTGLGLGISGSQRLADDFKIETSPHGTTIELRKALPKSSRLVDTRRLGEITRALLRESIADPFEEIQRQNQELLQTLAELRERQEDLLLLNRELEDTNRGVVALYAELEQTAENLRRADQSKTRFFSSMSHEFRTPLNSQLALSRMLLDRADGDLTEEQEKQVRLLRRGAETLLELVNDLLDLAKIAAGKTSVRVEEFTVRDLFSTLRGMIRPLLVTDAVELIFDEPGGDAPPLVTDEGKVAQILRNFTSNALKFTIRGTVRVRARVSESGETIEFTVADTGVGIAPENTEAVFEEFVQIENPQQKQYKGTGLGLPLARRLAELLGGAVAVESALGVGTTFTAHIPRIFREPTDAVSAITAADQPPAPAAVSDSDRILIIDDDEAARYVLKKMLAELNYETAETANGAEGIELARQIAPRLIFLDLEMPEMHGGEVLRRLKADPQTTSIPVVVNTSLNLDACREFEPTAARLVSKNDLTIEKVSEIINSIFKTPEDVRV